jgi:hypothetical protein
MKEYNWKAVADRFIVESGVVAGNLHGELSVRIDTGNVNESANVEPGAPPPAVLTLVEATNQALAMVKIP